MANLIERYVYDVTRRLPENERTEVSKELQANIYDMLADDATEEEISFVLAELGAPAFLAEKYRQKPRYLISPAVYDDYIRVLRWVSPLVGVLCFGLGVALGASDAVYDGSLSLIAALTTILTQGLNMGLSATLQVLLWVTIGFAAADRARSKTSESRVWTVDQLPALPPHGKGKIRLADSITELALTLVFSTLAFLAARGVIPTILVFQGGSLQIHTLFSASFLASLAPAILIMAPLATFASIVKLVQGRWTPFVATTVTISKLVNMGVLLYLLNKPQVFSIEFLSLLEGLNLGGLGFSGRGPFLLLASFIIIVSSLAESGYAIYQTRKSLA